jgi:hypothetical protein
MTETLFNCLCFAGLIILVNARGRMINPPHRGSMWRYGFDTPQDYNDMSLNCGGIQQQWSINKGKWFIILK